MKSTFQSNIFSTNKTLLVGGRLMDLRIAKVMGILNVSPDSFYDGGRSVSEAQVLKQAEKMLSEGADVLDIGGYSTRPGADDIAVEEELQRIIPAIRSVIKNFPEAIISIDTFRSEVASVAVHEGAHIINDISGGSLDENMFTTVAHLQVPYILMHMKGTPKTMKQETTYDNLLKDIIDFFHLRINMLQRLGVKDVIVDPGFGFAKTIAQNFELLEHLDHFKILGKPLLIGLSRKSMVWKTLSIQPDQALNGTTSLHTIALLKGASILRVHDVKEAVEAVKLYSMLAG